MPKKIAVIGAGIGGIAVASRLAVKGYEVDVFEKNDLPGGKMSEIRHDGFRFDTGPSLFTLPHLIGELFELAGEDIANHLQYSKLRLICRYFYEDGMIINAYDEAEAFSSELFRKAGEDRQKVIRYLGASHRIYDFTYPVFIRSSLHRFKNYYSGDFIRALFLLPRLKPFKTLHHINQRSFTHPNTVQLFDRFATYNGSDPFKTPATMMVIPHLEHNLGAYFPGKGMYEIVRALTSLLARNGARLHFNSEVEEILLSGNKVSGIRVNGEDFSDYEIIVSDVDNHFLYKKLLKKSPFPEKWFRHERSTSALIFYWGMETESPGLDLHNILFSSDYKQEFNCLFNLKTLYPDPTVYIFISSKVVAEDAPSGYENWFVMINAPENTGQDWDQMIADARGRIEEKISRLTGIDVIKYRKFEFIMDPRDIEKKTASYLGSLYGNSSNSVWAAFQRHPNFSKIRGLYLTGGSVHPGGGIPLCLSSAKIVADMIPSIKK
jgi:phytoene desaturase